MPSPTEQYKRLMDQDYKVQIVPMSSMVRNILCFLTLVFAAVGLGDYYMIQRVQQEQSDGQARIEQEQITGQKYTVTNYNVGLKNRLIYCEVLDDLKVQKSPSVDQLCNDPAVLALRVNPNQSFPQPGQR